MAERSGGNRTVSPLLLFAFLRDCKNLAHFAYDGWSEHISEPLAAPLGRRMRLRSLRLDITNHADKPESDLHALAVRSRFLSQFPLPHLVEYSGYTYCGDRAFHVALERMVNLEMLRLIEDFSLEHGGLGDLIERLPRLAKLKHLDLALTADVDARPSSASHADLQRLLDAIPESVELLKLYIPLPETMAEAFFERRMHGSLRDLRTFVFDPLEVNPTPEAVHFYRIVTQSNVSDDGSDSDDYAWLGVGECDLYGEI